MISVCMATYQGEAYVARQLESILAQIGKDDEVVVVDDASRDNTVGILRGLNDDRIKIHVNPHNRREVYSFGRAIELARGDVIFLSDQDDIWLPGRVELMKRRLRDSGALLVTTNFTWMDENETNVDVKFDGVDAARSSAHFGNIIDIFIGKTNYFGCAMAFRRELVCLITPIPAYVESHDLWIALAANLTKSNLHLDEATFRKRRHGSNATSTVSTRSLGKKLAARAIFARSIVELLKRQQTKRAGATRAPAE